MLTIDRALALKQLPIPRRWEVIAGVLVGLRPKIAAAISRAESRELTDLPSAVRVYRRAICEWWDVIRKLQAAGVVEHLPSEPTVTTGAEARTALDSLVQFAQSEASKGAVGQDAKKKSPKPKRPRGRPRGQGRVTINTRMLAMVSADPLAVGWSARQWAEKLQCSTGTVGVTEAWRLWAAMRIQAKAARRTDRRRRPNKVNQRDD